MTTVLGLVRRDLLIEIADAVAREDGAAVFELAGRAVESGYDLRLVVRELARLTRDLLVIGVDPSRARRSGDRGRSRARRACRRWRRSSRAEDLMRAFDVLTKAEVDIRGSMQPRYHLEMALLRWIHLRKLVPLTDLIQGLRRSALDGAPAPRLPRQAVRRRRQPGPRPARPPRHRPARSSAAPGRAARAGAASATARRRGGPLTASDAEGRAARRNPEAQEVLLRHGVAQAQRIDVEPDRVVFSVRPAAPRASAAAGAEARVARGVATRLAGPPMAVVAVDGDGAAPGKAGDSAASARPPAPASRATSRRS